MPSIQWYFVCRDCNAKWFERTKVGRCPRCARVARSREKLPIPWLKTLPTETSSSAVVQPRRA